MTAVDKSKSKKTGKPKRPPGRPPKSLPTDDSGQLTADAAIGQLLRETRKRKRLAAGYCAEAAGVSLSRWYDFEAGRATFANLPAAKLQAISAAAGLAKNRIAGMIE